LCQHFEQPQVDLDPREPEYQGVYLRLYKEIAQLAAEELKKDELWSLYSDLELPLVSALADMEAHGIVLDPAKLEIISVELEETLQRLTKVIYDEAGEEFNINSPKQLGVILFDKLGLPVLKRTKTGPSTSAGVLEELSDHAIVASVLEYRQVAKLKSTYTDSLAELISPETKRIHTTFNQTVTATGRLSSTHPNLQNIPVRTKEGRRIREAFVAPEGHVLLMADYSQIELRLLAHLSGDQVLQDAFRSGQDIHAQTAAEVFGQALDQVTSEQRSAAKAINFGIIYGISSFGLAKGINLTRAEAQEYIDSYFLRYPMVKVYLDSMVEQGKRDGYVTTLAGRRRYLPNLQSRNFALRSFAARTAMNTPIQGSAADIIKLAMLKVYRALQASKLKSRLLLQVHDELVLEVPIAELDSAGHLVKREMEGVYPLVIPLEVGISYGPNWRDVTSFDAKE
jgi:DNA polymerase-1